MLGNVWNRKPRGTRASRNRIRPMLEALEDRLTPSTVTENAANAVQLQAYLSNATAANTQYVINLTGASADYKLAAGTELTIPTIGAGGSVTIVGSGQSIAGNGNRVFLVNAGANTTLENLTITGGSAVATGGGLYDVGGKVALSDVTVSGNTASTGTSFGSGGGVFVSIGGTLTLNNHCVIEGNSVVGSNAFGGGIYASGNLSISGGSTVRSNAAIGRTGTTSNAFGGGIYVAAGASLSLSDSTVQNNIVQGSTPNSKNAGGGGSAYGGGIYFSAGGVLTLSDAQITGNNARGGLGAAGANATKTGAAGGKGNSGGGAYGGGLYVRNGATLQITATAVTGNIALGGVGGGGGGGGVLASGGVGGDGGAVLGGGAFLSTSPTATSTILNSSFTGNLVIGGVGGVGGVGGAARGGGGTGGNGGDSSGGGIYLTAGNVQILNTTLAVNQANGGTAGVGGSNGSVNGNGTGTGTGANGTAGNSSGGGIDILKNATITLINDTLYQNAASGHDSSGGGVAVTSANPTLFNNLLLNNSAAANADTNLTLSSANDNLTTAGTNGQAILGTQQTTANGLVYYPLLPGNNPAIDKGNNSALTAIAAAEGIANNNATDEIGGARLVNGVIDIGAIEFSPTPTGGGSGGGGNGGGGGNSGGGTNHHPSLFQAAFTIAFDAAELVLEANGLGTSVFPPSMTLLEQILADLPYAENFALTALQVGIQAGQHFVDAR